jgi:hypothetical protein
VLKLPLKLINKFFNLLEYRTLLDIKLNYDSKLLGVCLIDSGKEYKSMPPGLYLYIVDMYNFLPISRTYIGKGKKLYEFNDNGVIIEEEHFDIHIPFDSFIFCLLPDDYLINWSDELKSEYSDYKVNLIHSYSTSYNLSEACGIVNRHKPLSNIINKNVLYKLCEDINNSIEELENNYSIEFIKE